MSNRPLNQRHKSRDQRKESSECGARIALRTEPLMRVEQYVLQYSNFDTIPFRAFYLGLADYLPGPSPLRLGTAIVVVHMHYYPHVCIL